MNRKLLLPLAAVAVVLGACSSTTASTTSTTSSTSTVAIVTTTSSTTTNAPQTTTSTPTTTAPTTTTPGSPLTETPAVYRVTGVADPDVLNVRSGPGVSNDIVGEYDPTATNVLTTGQGTTLSDGVTWVEATDPDFTGWVNKRFLELVDQTAAPLGEYPCSVGPGMTGTMPNVWPGPSGGSNADHVFSIEQIDGGGCSRTVITLGTDFDWENPGAPADRVPADVAGIDGASRVRHVLIDMPTVHHAVPSADGSSETFLARKTEGPTEEFGKHGLVLNVPTGPGVHNVFYLESPARIVVDHWFSRSGEGRSRWTTGTGVILINPTRPPTGVPFLEDGVQFNGYARGFEASLSAQIVKSSNGQAAIVTWTPQWDGDPVTSDWYITTVNDWTEAWGQFSFEVTGLSGLPIGGYTLVLMTDNAADSDDFEILEYDFVVGPRPTS